MSPDGGIPRRAHFYNGDKSILVSFFDSKELISWSLSSWEIVSKVRSRCRHGDSAWDPNTQSLASWNVSTGVDVYSCDGNGTPVFTNTLAVKEVSARRNYIIWVAFAQDRKLIVHGGESRQVYVWSIQSQKRVQILDHGHASLVVQCVTCISPREDFHMIASGSSTPNDESPTIRIWSTRPKVREPVHP
ncbi:WD40-repeat-containing domain protein [Amylostereum chailletii]|nr:WD40-repeat-containing domain protein [Amylostereum chailletii]